jgi:hypothetical protein
VTKGEFSAAKLAVLLLTNFELLLDLEDGVALVVGPGRVADLRIKANQLIARLWADGRKKSKRS